MRDQQQIERGDILLVGWWVTYAVGAVLVLALVGLGTILSALWRLVA